MASAAQFSAGMAIGRWLVTTALVQITYNPFGRSYYHWVSGEGGDLLLQALAGLSLLIAYVFLGWVILGSVGIPGVLAMIAIWGLLSHQLLGFTAVDEPLLRESLVLLSLSTTLTAGLVWPHAVTRLNGQIEKRYLEGKQKKTGPGL